MIYICFTWKVSTEYDQNGQERPTYFSCPKLIKFFKYLGNSWTTKRAVPSKWKKSFIEKYWSLQIKWGLFS